MQNNKNIYSIIDDLIKNNNVTDYNDLTESDKQEIASWLLFYDKSTDWLDALVDTESRFNLCKVLINASAENNEELIEQMKKDMVKHFKLTTTLLIKERLESMEAYRYDE